MSVSATLYPNSDAYSILQIAPRGHGYLFHVTRQDGVVVSFVLVDWEASEYTIRWLEREGHTLHVSSLAYEPDEDFLNELLQPPQAPLSCSSRRECLLRKTGH